MKVLSEIPLIHGSILEPIDHEKELRDLLDNLPPESEGIEQDLKNEEHRKRSMKRQRNIFNRGRIH